MDVGSLLSRTALAYPRHPITPDTFDVYLNDLMVVPEPLLQKALERLVRTSEWFPSIRAIREACAELALELPSDTEALSDVDAALAGGGAVPKDALHPIAWEAVRLAGGLREFRTSTEPNVVRGQFCRFFRDLRTAAIRDAMVSDSIVPLVRGIAA